MESRAHKPQKSSEIALPSQSEEQKPVPPWKNKTGKGQSSAGKGQTGKRAFLNSSSSKSAGKGHVSKRQRTDRSSRNEFQAVKRLAVCNSMLSLQTARISRLLYAAAVVTIFVPTCGLTDALEWVSEDPIEPQFLPAQKWGDLQFAIVDEPHVTEEIKVPIRNHIAHTPNREALLPHILVCQCAPFKRNAEMHKVQIRVSSEFHHVASFVLKAFVLVGGTIQFGPAPRTALELQTQEALDAVRLFS